MEAAKPRKRQQGLLTGLCIILALSYFLGAWTKFQPGETFFGPPYSEKFVNWGYPAWFRFVVGAGELLGAILLLIPRVRFWGAVGLVLILIGAVITHIVNHDPLSHSISAPINLVLMLIVAYTSRSAKGKTIKK